MCRAPRPRREDERSSLVEKSELSAFFLLQGKGVARGKGFLQKEEGKGSPFSRKVLFSKTVFVGIRIPSTVLAVLAFESEVPAKGERHVPVGRDRVMERRRLGPGLED